ncbi:MAG: PAS domain S-box protein [Melioribacteraceae bacterium]|nr:PAS domain S-box protein [Melioribacteraceae bacterium]
MTDKEKLKELEANLEILEEENASLSLRSVEILLLNLISDSIRFVEDKDLIIEDILEKISILKNIPFTAYIKFNDDGKVEVLHRYFSRLQTDLVEEEIQIKNTFYDAKKNDEYIFIYSKEEFTENNITLKFLHESFVPQILTVIPINSDFIENRAIILIDDEPDRNKYTSMLILLTQLSELIINKLDKLFLVKRLQEINQSLEQKVEERTKELKELNEKLKVEVENKKNLLEELIVSKERYKALFNNSTDGIILWEEKGDRVECIDINKVALNKLGYSRTEFLNLTPKDINTGEGLKRYPEILKLLKKNKSAIFESIYVKKDGTKYPVEINIHLFRLLGKNVILSTSRDITERKEAEYNLRESESKFRTAFKTSPDAILITDMETSKIVDLNDGFMKISGYSREELIGKTTVEMNIWADIKDRENIVSTLKEFGEIENYEAKFGLKDDKVIIGLFSANIITINERLHLLSITRDITDRIEMIEELKEAKVEAENASKLKSEFLAQMSHEIRTPINTILSYSSLLKSGIDGCEIPDELDECFPAMDNAGKRIIRTIDLILNMSEMQTESYNPNFKKADIIKLAKKVCDEFKYSAKENNLDLQFNSEVKNYFISFDDYTMGQIFSNLLNNAIKYTHKGFVKINITFDSILSIQIIDSGIGISSDYLPYIFDSFSQEEQGYTRRFEGNGLGLALVKKYCEINNADIFVKSKKNEGAVFTIIFREIND